MSGVVVASSKFSPCQEHDCILRDKRDCSKECKRLEAYNKGESWAHLPISSIGAVPDPAVEESPKIVVADRLCIKCGKRKPVKKGDSGLCGWCRGNKKRRENTEKHRARLLKTATEGAIWELARVLRKEMEDSRVRVLARLGDLHTRLCILEDLKTGVEDLRDTHKAIEAISLRCERLESLLSNHDHDPFGRVRLFITMEDALKPLPKLKGR